MRFSLNFIKELLSVDMSPKELADTLTMAGMEVEHIEKTGNDWIFDIEVTTNRYDWLSIVGIAREIAACLHKKFRLDKPVIVKKPLIKDKKIIIADLKDCPFYVGRIIRGVRVKQSPEWFKQRVVNCGINSISNVVDVTNYCMLKWGNPLHAFDLDKIEGDVYVRRAVEGEAFVGIDEKERVLNSTNLVIADDRKVIALAGVIGGKNTEVDENTKDIFLEAAIFSPLTTRHSRRSAGVDTESSYRFERMVHPDYLEYASQQAASFIEELGSGKFEGYAESGKKPAIKQEKINISLEHMSSYLGGEFSAAKVKAILSNLGFSFQETSKQKIVAVTPAARMDIKREVDVYEEFARIYGYENIQNRIPFLVSQENGAVNAGVMGGLYTFKNELRCFLESLGMKEIVTYSIEAEEEFVRLGEKDFIPLANPMRKQENVMRSSLLLGMIKSVRHNLNRGARCLRFFEAANVYYRNKTGFSENSFLALGVSGQERELFYLKKVVQELAWFLNRKTVEFRENSLLNFHNALDVIVDGNRIGFIGKLDDKIRKEFDLKENLFFSQFDTAFLTGFRLDKEYKTFSQYPAVWRDISIALKKDGKFREIEKAAADIGGDFFAGISLVDEYKGKDLPEDYRAFTLRIFFQSPEKTLTSEEVDSLNNRIRENLSKRQGVTLR